MPYAFRFNVILAAKLRFLFQIGVIIAKNNKFFLQFLGNVKADWGFLTIFANDLKSETAILMRGRANENEKWLPRCGATVLKTEWDFPDAGQTV